MYVPVRMVELLPSPISTALALRVSLGKAFLSEVQLPMELLLFHVGKWKRKGAALAIWIIETCARSVTSWFVQINRN